MIIDAFREERYRAFLDVALAVRVDVNALPGVRFLFLPLVCPPK